MQIHRVDKEPKEEGVFAGKTDRKLKRHPNDGSLCAVLQQCAKEYVQNGHPNKPWCFFGCIISLEVTSYEV